MAPRGRPRPPRLTRMDAAVDAMIPLGFPEKLVRRRVKDLLKEYGGDDGWPFIEADAYRLLIDTFLDEQEEEIKEKCNEEKNNLLLDEPLRNERAGDYSVAADTGPSGLVLAPICSEVADAAAQTIETEGRDCLQPAEGEGKGWKDIGLDQNSDEKDLADVIGKGEDDSGREMQLDDTPLPSPPSVIPSPPQVNSLPIRRRKPCYGWISSDDEEDFIELTPAVRSTPAKPPAQAGDMISGQDKLHKRKSRWDVRPEDM